MQLVARKETIPIEHIALLLSLLHQTSGLAHSWPTGKVVDKPVRTKWFTLQFVTQSYAGPEYI